MSTRRTFFKQSSLLAASSAMRLGHSKNGFFAQAPANKDIGLQMYAIGSDLVTDPQKTLKTLRNMGYTHLELYGYKVEDGKANILGHEPDEYKKMLDDSGFKVTSSHLRPPLKQHITRGDGGGTGKGARLLYLEKYTPGNIGQILEFWKRASEDHNKLGIRVVVQPELPTVESDYDAQFLADAYNKIGEVCKKAGLRFGHHNHSAEFLRFGDKPYENPGKNFTATGTILYDFLLENTDPSLVFYEMDVYWTVMANCDPVRYFQKYPGRFPILHIKDRDIIGSTGFMNFENIFKYAYANGGLQWYYVELERVEKGQNQLDSIGKSYTYLADAPFVKRSTIGQGF